jgi:tetratricopeptide (TPR) repeat protein
VQAGLAEQTRALEHARAAGSIELQLRALSGLGDAHYAGGRVVSAYRDFKECVELSRAQRIVQVEAANLPMLAICGYWVTRIEESLEQARAALELARRIASPRSELIAHHAGCILALQSAELAAALAHAQASLQVAQAIGARRFVPESMMFIAICLGEQGARDDARGLLLEALELSREHISYCGPWILGCLLRYADDDAQRSAWLREGEAVLDAGGPAHNIFGFYSNAIEAALETGQWDVALRYCDRFEAHFRVEPAPLCDFEVARGRALARFGRGERGSDLREALRRLVAQARGAGLRAGLRALEAASERMPAEPSRA